MKCPGCSTEDGALPGAHPESSHCEDCPPWLCPDCGQTDSMASPCLCWISFDGMALADIKGLLALGGLSLGVPE